jgi:hypothetical protein
MPRGVLSRRGLIFALFSEWGGWFGSEPHVRFYASFVVHGLKRNQSTSAGRVWCENLGGCLFRSLQGRAEEDDILKSVAPILKKGFSILKGGPSWWVDFPPPGPQKCRMKACSGRAGRKCSHNFLFLPLPLAKS